MAVQPDSIFVVTAAGDSAAANRAKTIDQGVSISLIAQFAPAEASRLAEGATDQVRAWGATPGRFNNANFERMRIGDLALIYAGQGRFDAALQVIGKTIDARLSRELWGEASDGSTWEQISFYGEPLQIDLSLESLRQMLGYADSWTPQGFQYPAEEHQFTLLEKFGTLGTFVSSIGSDGPGATDKNPDAVLLGEPHSNQPPKRPKQRSYRDDLDPDVTSRGYLAHEEIVAQVADFIGDEFRTGTPGINHDGAWVIEGVFHLTEVKSINGKNEVSQVQKGIGQLLHNRKKALANGASAVEAHLILEREPSTPMWGEICEEVSLGLTWPGRFEEDLTRPL